MDDEMIERVAKALGKDDKTYDVNYDELAIAAIKAMREPTDIIRQVQCWSMNYSTEELWTKFIDFILKANK